MDRNFNEMFTARLQQLTADLRFFHRPSGQNIAPQVIMCMLPPQEGKFIEGNDFPVICWTHHSGLLTHLQPSSFQIAVDCGLRVDTSHGKPISHISQGSEDILALIAALHRLAGARNFGRYKLQIPFSYTIGDSSAGSEGRQPHPYYWVRFNLSFVAHISGRE